MIQKSDILKIGFLVFIALAAVELYWIGFNDGVQYAISIQQIPAVSLPGGGI